MSTYLVGFEVKKGQFNNNGGEAVDYNNRLLNFVTDDGQTANSFGFTGFQIKLKMSEVAVSLGVPERDESVDSALQKVFRKKVDFVHAPKNGKLEIVGFCPDFGE